MYTNGAKIQTSPDDSVWTDRVTISGVAEDAQSDFGISVNARYVRIYDPGNYVGLGDFKIDYTALALPTRHRSSRPLVFPG